jgi:hypothetical protein
MMLQVQKIHNFNNIKMNNIEKIHQNIIEVYFLCGKKF